MIAPVLAVVTVVLLSTTGLTAAATLGIRRLPDWLLAAYLLAFGEVVALVLALSLVGQVRRPALLAAMAALCSISVWLWWRRGHSVPLTSRRLRVLAADLRTHPVVPVLAVAVGLVALYLGALIVGTAPNNWDSMTYHLARAAFWRQQGGVGYVEDAYDERLNANPPNAEVALAFVLEVIRDERIAGFVQYSAWIACAIGVGGLSRRLGLTTREACFGAMLFLLLPIVVLEGSTTQNDLVVASFLIAATVFLIGESRAELALAALAIALAIGTKFTAPYALVLLTVVAVVAAPHSKRIGRLLALGVGSLAGSFWYLVNVLETGALLGDSAGNDLLTVLRPSENLLAAFARVLDLFELPGARSGGGYTYVVVGLLLVAFLVATAVRSGQMTRAAALVAGGLVVLPLAVAPASYVVWRVVAKLDDVLGTPDGRVPVDGWESQTVASEVLSWFGALGLLLVAGVGIVALVLVRRRTLPNLAAVLAVAPLVWLALISATIAYDPWQGRFFVYPVALSASLWGLVLRRPPIAWAAATVAATTAALSLFHYFEKSVSVWGGMSRSEVQSVIDTGVGPMLEFLDEQVPADATVALALSEDDFGYPAFGPRLERRVTLVPHESDARRIDAEWLVANPARAGQIERTCWHAVLHSDRAVVFQRRTTAPCRDSMHTRPALRS